MSIGAIARRVARLLKDTDCRVVFAESCTGGLVSGALTAVPGISNYHCGGVVVYRDATKRAYLKIPRVLLEKAGAVSREVAELMAVRVLARTPEAGIAVSVTGHLGPDAPAALDGVVFVGIARRGGARSADAALKVHRLRCNKEDGRVARQRWVVERVLELLIHSLEANDHI